MDSSARCAVKICCQDQRHLKASSTKNVLLSYRPKVTTGGNRLHSLTKQMALEAADMEVERCKRQLDSMKTLLSHLRLLRRPAWLHSGLLWLRKRQSGKRLCECMPADTAQISAVIAANMLPSSSRPDDARSFARVHFGHCRWVAAAGDLQGLRWCRRSDLEPWNSCDKRQRRVFQVVIQHVTSL